MRRCTFVAIKTSNIAVEEVRGDAIEGGNARQPTAVFGDEFEVAYAVNATQEGRNKSHAVLYTVSTVKGNVPTIGRRFPKEVNLEGAVIHMLDKAVKEGEVLVAFNFKGPTYFGGGVRSIEVVTKGLDVNGLQNCKTVVDVSPPEQRTEGGEGAECTLFNVSSVQLACWTSNGPTNGETITLTEYRAIRGNEEDSTAQTDEVQDSVRRHMEFQHNPSLLGDEEVADYNKARRHGGRWVHRINVVGDKGASRREGVVMRPFAQDGDEFKRVL